MNKAFKYTAKKNNIVIAADKKIDWSVVIKGNNELKNLFFEELCEYTAKRQARLMAEINYINQTFKQENTPMIMPENYHFLSSDDFKTKDFKDFKVLGVDKREDEDTVLHICSVCDNPECAYHGKRAASYCKCFQREKGINI